MTDTPAISSEMREDDLVRIRLTDNSIRVGDGPQPPQTNEALSFDEFGVPVGFEDWGGE